MGTHMKIEGLQLIVHLQQLLLLASVLEMPGLLELVNRVFHSMFARLQHHMLAELPQHHVINLLFPGL
jgi:hypothetical protein